MGLGQDKHRSQQIAFIMRFPFGIREIVLYYLNQTKARMLVFLEALSFLDCEQNDRYTVYATDYPAEAISD